MKRNCKKLVEKNSEWKRYLKEHVINCMSVEWKGYNNSFNSWIDKKDLV